jgi:prophage maintenance system killer protein
LVADQVGAVQTIMRLAAGHLTEQQLAEWVRSHSLRRI